MVVCGFRISWFSEFDSNHSDMIAWKQRRNTFRRMFSARIAIKGNVTTAPVLWSFNVCSRCCWSQLASWCLEVVILILEIQESWFTDRPLRQPEVWHLRIDAAIRSVPLLCRYCCQKQKRYCPWIDDDKNSCNERKDSRVVYEYCCVTEVSSSCHGPTILAI